MIVLAIAGLILAVVFIAVPALQRNTRNTQRQSDLASLKAQFDTAVANNRNTVPSSAAIFQSQVASQINTNQFTATAVSAAPNYSTANGNVLFYKNAHGAIEHATALNNVVKNDRTNLLIVVAGAKCNTGTGAATVFDTNTGANTALTIDDAMVVKDHKNIVAWIYKLEGEAFLRCNDDVN